MIIKKVEIKGNIVKILIDDNSSFKISLETYLENSILVNDEISKEKIDELIKKSKKDIVKLELLNKLSRKKLSKKECIEFLKERLLEDDEIKEIVYGLEKNYLINDKELIEFIIDYSLMKKKGIEAIKKNLLDRGLWVDYSFIENYIDNDKYNQNMLYQIEKYKRMGKNKSNRALKTYLNDKMIENGYRQFEFNDFINDENKDEKEIIIKEIAKFIRNKEIDEEIIAKITKKLLSKGFNYAIIKEAIRSVVENETY